MRHVLAVALAVALTATPALSLSCMKPDVVRSYQQAADADDHFVVVSGTLSHSRVPIPSGKREGQQPLTFTAKLVGKYLQNDGFTGDFAAPVEVTLNCVSVWCATLPPQNSKVLAFVKLTPTRYEIDAQPCPTWLFDEPEPDQMVRLVMCHTKGDCPTE